MGLDITFYAQSKSDPRYHREVGYFDKVNFLLTYFGIIDEDNCNRIKISKDKVENLISDLKIELSSHKDKWLPTYYKNDSIQVEPNNDKLKTSNVFFGGSTDYGICYWNNIRWVYRWAVDLIKNNEVDFNHDDLIMLCWW